MVRPTFFVIGAAKCGTSSLYHLISQHPEVCFSTPKEPRFFSHDLNYEKGWAWYATCFPCADRLPAVGEGSVHYSMRSLFPDTARRIAQAVPEAKILYIVRHPLDRIVSHYRMYAGGKKNFPPLSVLIKKDHLRPNFIDASRYWYQIQAYREFFPDTQILILFFEDFFKHPEQAVSEVFRFLQVSFHVRMKNPRRAYNAQLADKRFLRFLRRLPIYTTLSRLLPGEIKKNIRRSLLATRAEPRPLWDPEVYRWAASQVEDDAREFLRFYGKEPDYWTFHDEITQ